MASGDGVGISAAYGALRTDKETGRMQVGALIGNLDPNTISDGIISVKLQKADFYKDKVTLNVDAKIPAIESLRTKAETLSSSLKKLTNDLRSNVLSSDSSVPNALNAKLSRSKESDGAIVLSIDPIAKASITDYDIFVTQKATADSVTCNMSFKDPNNPVDFSGNLVLNNQVIPITEGTSTLNSIINAINSRTEFSNVKARSLEVSSTKGYVLILESTKLAEPINFLGNAGTDTSILNAGGLNITQTDPVGFDPDATDQITTGYTNTSKTDAVGFSGNLVINNQAITISATSTLTSIMDSINYVRNRTNVTASLSAGPNYALVLTSTKTGEPIRFDALTTDTSLKGDTAALVPLANTAADDLVGEDLIAIKDKITSTYTTTDPTSGANFSGNLLINNQLIKITASSSLNNIRDAINALSKEANVTASIVTEEGLSKLVIEGTQAGVPINFTGATTDDSLRGEGRLILPTTNTQPDALIAKLSVNGTNIERPDNIISDAIIGVRITVDKVSTAHTIFAIDHDKKQAFEAISEFVTNYNLLVDAVNEQRKMMADGSTPDEKSILYNEDILNGIDSLLRYATNVAVVGSGSSDYKSLGDIGIMLSSSTSGEENNELSGKLSLNATVLQERILNDDFDKIIKLFGNFAQSTDPKFYAVGMPEKFTEDMAGKPITVTYSHVGATSEDPVFATNFSVPEPAKRLDYAISGQTVSLTYTCNEDGSYTANILGSEFKDILDKPIPAEKLTANATLSNNNKTFTFPDDSIYAGLVVNFKDDATQPTYGAPITTTFTLPQFTAKISMSGKEDVIVNNVRDDFIKAPQNSIYAGLKIGYVVMGKYTPLTFGQSTHTTLTLTSGVAVGFDKALSSATHRYNPKKDEVPTSMFDVSIQTLLEENKSNEERVKEIIDDAERIRERSDQNRQKLYMQAHKTVAISQMLAAELASHYG